MQFLIIVHSILLGMQQSPINQPAIWLNALRSIPVNLDHIHEHLQEIKPDLCTLLPNSTFEYPNSMDLEEVLKIHGDETLFLAKVTEIHQKNTNNGYYYLYFTNIDGVIAIIARAKTITNIELLCINWYYLANPHEYAIFTQKNAHRLPHD